MTEVSCGLKIIRNKNSNETMIYWEDWRKNYDVWLWLFKQNIIGYLEAKCGYKVSKEDVIKEATFTSVWDGYEITTSCKVNTVTREIFDIEKIDVPTDDDGDELEILDREYVTVDGVEYCAGSAYSETEGWNPDKDYWYN